MLEETAEYLKNKKYKYEIIIANDGSKDNTTIVALETSKKLNINTFVVECPQNRGKGGAVRAGVQVAKGQYVLMVDADGATKFSDFSKL
jgi:dolichyl-phosphate beta-glucosyltransferase